MTDAVHDFEEAFNKRVRSDAIFLNFQTTFDGVLSKNVNSMLVPFENNDETLSGLGWAQKTSLNILGPSRKSCKK